MNLTLAIEEKLVERAREVAARQGTSLQALVRQYIETLAGVRDGAALARRLEEQWQAADQRKKTAPYLFDRDALYEKRTARRGRK